MGCTDASLWHCPSVPMAIATTKCSTSTSFKLQPFFTKPLIFCCVNGPSDSTAPSSSESFTRLRYNPLRQRRFDQSLEISRRRWVEADPPPQYQERFMAVSYNILGDRNASKHGDLYPNVPSIYMKWHRRKRAICEELIGLNPHIICLQEVDKYFDLWTIMEKAGYSGSYKTCKAESKRLLIANTHVLYNPSRGDIKLGQLRYLLSRAHILSEKWGNIPVVLAGDFNTTPQSGIYEFLSSSKLNVMLHDRRELSGQRSCHPAQIFGVKKEMGNPLVLTDRLVNCCWTVEEVKIATGNAECQVVVHPLKLISSYATVKGSTKTRDSDGEPLATSYHSKFLGTVDYLWYSDGIVPTRVLDTLPIDDLRKTGGLPCKNFGSDHLALVSEFAFIQNTKDSMSDNTTDSTV
ncbi:carbon catabolite repressor protein 4 homolog 3 isoform X2 [Cornus florida]|uniref:carbon catabolite repressor protein 4 homolog 3 isoform X2 n=1 Tax=Cornus florida TaxID=4283 RepID=UPI002897C092|nr:carbon catabolite repressor protein 4 homolog 3 isoform X2 [Cornus florida]